MEKLGFEPEFDFLQSLSSPHLTVGVSSWRSRQFYGCSVTSSKIPLYNNPHILTFRYSGSSHSLSSAARFQGPGSLLPAMTLPPRTVPEWLPQGEKSRVNGIANDENDASVLRDSPAGLQSRKWRKQSAPRNHQLQDSRHVGCAAGTMAVSQTVVEIQPNMVPPTHECWASDRCMSVSELVVGWLGYAGGVTALPRAVYISFYGNTNIIELRDAEHFPPSKAPEQTTQVCRALHGPNGPALCWVWSRGTSGRRI